MGTKVQNKSYLPGCHLMGDLNDNCNNGTWPLFYGDKPSNNGHFDELHKHRTMADAYTGFHTDAVKQKILEHEAIFKTQLYELHRLYRVQRDLMDEFKMIEMEKRSMVTETSMSSCSASHLHGDQRQETSSAFWLSVSGSTKNLHSTRSFSNGIRPQNCFVSPCNAERNKDCEVEILDSMRSTGKRKYNLQLQTDDYIDVKEPACHSDKASCDSKYATYVHCETPPSSSTKIFPRNSIGIQDQGNVATLNKDQNERADLNEKIQLEASGCGRLRSVTKWSHMLNSAQSNGQTSIYSQHLQSERINLHNKGQNVPFSGTGQTNTEHWNKISERVSKNTGSGISFFDHLHNPQQLEKSFFTSNQFWEKPGRKHETAEGYPGFKSAGTLPQSLQTSTKSTHQNGLYKEPYLTSGPVRYSTADSDYFNLSNGSFVASSLNFLQNGSSNINGLNKDNHNSLKGIDLNVASIGDSHDTVDKKGPGHISELQWLKSNKSISTLIYGPDSSAKSMGNPIFIEPHPSKGASSCRSSFLEKDEMYNNGRIRGFDMNLSCEYEENDTETVTFSERSFIDLNVNLMEEDNADQTTFAPGCHQVKMTNRGFDLEAPGEVEEEDMIQFKCPSPGSSDEDLVNVAAEAIVDILSFRELTLTQSPAISTQKKTSNVLKWFVDEIFSSSLDKADKVLYPNSGGDNEETNSLDYFEYMTLQLPDTKEDEYLPDYPKPPEPDELTGAGQLTSKTQKSQARRSRPRRDFQRDILPGLTSLARHEVTEDLQTFGGLMKATGQYWSSGITRARPRRGRPRLTSVQPHNPNPSQPLPKKITTAIINIEDHQNLTGWGKTTRRPRRQRVPAGNVSLLHTA